MYLGTIIVIEDDIITGRAIETALQSTTEGYDIVLTVSGRTAIKRMKSHWTPLMIVDYYLLDIDGIEVIQRIKKLSPQTKIIAISGATDNKILEAISSAGADRFLVKPFAMADFLVHVRDLLHISLVE